MKLNFDVWGHAVTSIFRLLDKQLEFPPEVIESAQLLDTCYIPARYPNGFSIGKPADYYNKRMAGEALDACEKIIKFCQDAIGKSG